jgi:hypothetical protein
VKQLGLGHFVYLNEYGKISPYSFHPDEFWMGLLRAHYGKTDEIRPCPTVPVPPERHPRREDPGNLFADCYDPAYKIFVWAATKAATA